MKFAEVAENVKQLVASRACETGCRARQQRSGNPPAKDEFIYELLLAYGTPRATIARLKAGQLNLSKEPGEVLLKKKVWFKPLNISNHEIHEPHEKGVSLFDAIEELKTAKGTKTNDPRFLIVTDFEQILAVDRKKDDTLDIELKDLESNILFFGPWAGMEKTKLSNENPADVKAAEKMAKLFDIIRQDNPDYLRNDAHAMNVFLGRLLFCLFAEDTNIFPENAVSNAVASHTADDGSDLDAFFKQLFDWLDTPDNQRIIHREGSQGSQKNKVGQASCLSAEEESLRSLRSFAVNVKNPPYVNGGLFRDHYDIPQFSTKARRMLIQAGTLDWKDINPDIFGSMFQAVIDPDERHNLGQHYTSVTNIMKVIEPLFLNEFKEKQTITMHVGNVLQERENHSGKTMAQLYDPDKMPDGLREAHHNLDLAVDRLYRSKPFTSDEERLEHLFKLYEEMTAKEKLV